MVGHVFGVPVTLQPVLGGILLHEITDAVAEVVGFEEEELDDEVADLSLVALVTPHRLRGNTQPSVHLFGNVHSETAELWKQGPVVQK